MKKKRLSARPYPVARVCVFVRVCVRALKFSVLRWCSFVRGVVLLNSKKKTEEQPNKVLL